MTLTKRIIPCLDVKNGRVVKGLHFESIKDSTRMTETVFADMMKKPEQGFDVMDPANVSPLVAWLASAASREISGHVFEIAGGKISIADGWRTGPEIDKGARWDAAEVGDAVSALLKRAVPPQKVYGA